MPAAKSSKRSSLPANSSRKAANNHSSSFASGVKKAVAGVGTKQQPQHAPLVNQFKPASNVGVVNAASLASLLGDLHLRPTTDPVQQSIAPVNQAHRTGNSAHAQSTSHQPHTNGVRGLASVGGQQHTPAAAVHNSHQSNNTAFTYDTHTNHYAPQHDSHPSKPLSPLAQYRNQNQSSNIFNGDDSQHQQQHQRSNSRPQTMLNGRQHHNDANLQPAPPSQPQSPQQRRRSTFTNGEAASILSPVQQSTTLQPSFRSDYVDDQTRAAKLRAQQEMREALAAQVAEKERRKRQQQQEDEPINSSRFSPQKAQRSHLPAEPEPNNDYQSQFNATQSSLPNTTHLAVETFNSTLSSALPTNTITAAPTVTNILARNAGDNRNRQMASSIFTADPKQQEESRLAKRAAEQAELQQQIEYKKQLKEQEKQRERLEEQRDNERWQREQQQLAARHGQHTTPAVVATPVAQHTLIPPAVPLSTAISLPPQPHGALPIAHPQPAQQPLQQQYWQQQHDNSHMAGRASVIEHELDPPPQPQSRHAGYQPQQQYYDDQSYAADHNYTTNSNSQLYDTLSQQYQQQSKAVKSPAKRVRQKKAAPIPPTAEEKRAADIAARRAKGDAQRKATALGKAVGNGMPNNLRRQSSVDLPATNSKGKWSKNADDAEQGAAGRNDRRRHSDNNFQLQQHSQAEEERPLRPLKQANGIAAKYNNHRPPTSDAYGESLAADSTFLAVQGDAEYDQSIDRYELEQMMQEMEHRLHTQNGHNGLSHADQGYDDDFDSHQPSVAQPQPNHRYGIQAKPSQRNMR